MGRVRSALTALAVAAVVVTACGSSKAASSASTDSSSASGASLPGAQLSLVAYSTPQEAYEEIIKAFQKTPEGKNITFTQSYGASGDQSRAVESGLRADIVAFSLEPDITRLVKDNIVAADWNAGAHKG